VFLLIRNSLNSAKTRDRVPHIYEDLYGNPIQWSVSKLINILIKNCIVSTLNRELSEYIEVKYKTTDVSEHVFATIFEHRYRYSLCTSAHCFKWLWYFNSYNNNNNNITCEAVFRPLYTILLDHYIKRRNMCDKSNVPETCESKRCDSADKNLLTRKIMSEMCKRYYYNICDSRVGITRKYKLENLVCIYLIFSLYRCSEPSR